MSDKEKLEKVYDFVKSQEDYFYKPIEDGKQEDFNSDEKNITKLEEK